MSSLLIAVICFAVGISALCSLMEAALYAVPMGHARHLASEGGRSGEVLLELKENMSKSISAILILNTIANSGGAAFAGALVVEEFGDSAVVTFSVFFTLAVLYLSEIIPKQIGVAYCKSVAPLISIPLMVTVRILTPLISLSGAVSKMLDRVQSPNVVSPEEVKSLADIGYEEGSLDELEGEVIKNVVALDSVLLRDVLTPRVVVFRISKGTKLKEVAESMHSWEFSRVPLYRESDPDHVDSYVLQRDLYRALCSGDDSELESALEEYSRELMVMPSLSRADKLLAQFFATGEHICGVVDEHGGFAGLVTLEDLVEEIIGKEIIDEYDKVVDMRKYAERLQKRKMWRAKAKEET